MCSTCSFIHKPIHGHLPSRTLSWSFTSATDGQAPELKTNVKKALLHHHNSVEGWRPMRRATSHFDAHWP